MSEFKTYYYQDGSTVRKYTESLPDQKTRRQERERERALERKRRARAQAKALRRNRAQALGMILGIAVLASLFAGYVHIQNTITGSMSHITELESQLSELKADNSATESRIATSANLNQVRNDAITRLGMVYANSDQIVYYDMQDEDYMNQYNDIR